MSPAALVRLGGWSGWSPAGCSTGSSTAAPACLRRCPWAQPLALVLVAAILFGTAWSTRRTIAQHPARLSPHQAVNRLVLARACAYVGALAAGAYLGYAVSWLGVGAANWQVSGPSGRPAPASAGMLVVVGGLLLERACRVPPEDDEP